MSVSKHNLPTWKKAGFAVLTVVGFFVLLEVLLALIGVAPILYSEDPYVGFAGKIPLFVEVPGGRPAYMVTAENKRGWFNDQSFPREKSSKTYRIFSMGGSTTYGRPYDDSLSFSGWLREFLNAADPSRDWEVINAGGISYASYRVAALMEELIRYQPNLFVIYTGHNEFLERRTYGEILERPEIVTSAGALAAHTRVFALGRRLLNTRSFRPDATVLEEEVDTILAHTIGPTDYTRDDEMRREIVAHFRFNLRRMAEIGRSAGAEVVFVTPASNLKDSAPFTSEGSVAPSSEFDRALEQGGARSVDGDLDGALEAYDRAVGIDPRHAEAQYGRGRVLYRLKRYPEAQDALARALNEDVCPLRAPQELVDAVREVAAETHAPLVDFVATVAQRAPESIPGSDQFMDHVHLNAQGYRQLALEIFDDLESRGVLQPSPEWNDQTLDRASKEVEARLDKRMHGVALRNLARVYVWARRMDEAEALAQQAAEVLGEDAETFNLLGRAASDRGEPEEAISYYRRALEIQPRHADAHASLAAELVTVERLDEAIEHANAALRIQPKFAEAHVSLGLAMAYRGFPDEAVEHYQAALVINPRYAEAHSNLGVELRALGRDEEAVQHFREALTFRPDYVDALSNLGVALASMGDVQGSAEALRRAVLLDPANVEAAFNLGVALLLDGAAEEAVESFNRAIERSPDFRDAHYNLGVALASLERPEDASASFNRALEIDPEFQDARDRLAELE